MDGTSLSGVDSGVQGERERFGDSSEDEIQVSVETENHLPREFGAYAHRESFEKRLVSPEFHKFLTECCSIFG